MGHPHVIKKWFRYFIKSMDESNRGIMRLIDKKIGTNEERKPDGMTSTNKS